VIALVTAFSFSSSLDHLLASPRLFGVAPSALNREEAALLAGSLPAPDRFDVNDPSARLQRREGWILDQMDGPGGPAYLSIIEH